MATTTFTVGPQEHDDASFRIFIANVPSSTTDVAFGSALCEILPIIAHVELRPPRRTRRDSVAAQTYAFLSFRSDVDRKDAIEKLTGYEFEGNVLRSEIAHSAQQREELREQRRQSREERLAQAQPGHEAGEGSTRPLVSEARAFVGNLPQDMTQDAFADTFGALATAELITRWDGTPASFGFVTFQDGAARDAFVDKWSGFELEGNELRVESAFARRSKRRRIRHPRHTDRSSPSTSPSSTPPPTSHVNKAYVGNLPQGITQEEFASSSETMGGQAELRVGRGGRTLRFGFISFDDLEARDAFVSHWNGTDYSGTSLVVEPANPLRRRPRRRRPRRRSSGSDRAD